MSVPVELTGLRAELERFGLLPYLLTVDGAGRPHAVACAVAWQGDALVCRVGARSTANAGERSLVSLLWPPYELGGYSLIVDGTASVTDGALELMPTKAVLHRPGVPAAAAVAGCGSDCVPLYRG